jgi:hypothetical protein
MQATPCGSALDGGEPILGFFPQIPYAARPCASLILHL